MLKPIKPAQIPKIKYKEPISLWLVDVNQRRKEDIKLKWEVIREEIKVYKHLPWEDFKIGSLTN